MRHQRTSLRTQNIQIVGDTHVYQMGSLCENAIVGDATLDTSESCVSLQLSLESRAGEPRDALVALIWYYSHRPPGGSLPSGGSISKHGDQTPKSTTMVQAIPSQRLISMQKYSIRGSRDP